MKPFLTHRGNMTFNKNRLATTIIIWFCRKQKIWLWCSLTHKTVFLTVRCVNGPDIILCVRTDAEFMGVSIFTYDGGFSRGSVGVLSSRVGVLEDSRVTIGSFIS